MRKTWNHYSSLTRRFHCEGGEVLRSRRGRAEGESWKRPDSVSKLMDQPGVAALFSRMPPSRVGPWEKAGLETLRPFQSEIVPPQGGVVVPDRKGP